MFKPTDIDLWVKQADTGHLTEVTKLYERIEGYKSNKRVENSRKDLIGFVVKCKLITKWVSITGY